MMSYQFGQEYQIPYGWKPSSVYMEERWVPYQEKAILIERGIHVRAKKQEADDQKSYTCKERDVGALTKW